MGLNEPFNVLLIFLFPKVPFSFCMAPLFIGVMIHEYYLYGGEELVAFPMVLASLGLNGPCGCWAMCGEWALWCWTMNGVDGIINNLAISLVFKYFV